MVTINDQCVREWFSIRQHVCVTEGRVSHMHVFVKQQQWGLVMTSGPVQCLGVDMQQSTTNQIK